jgi:hypothetical protein
MVATGSFEQILSKPTTTTDLGIALFVQLNKYQVRGFEQSGSNVT